MALTGNEDKKVYCGKCKHIRGIEERNNLSCHSPNNTKDSFLRKNGIPLQKPEEKNADNHCKDFEEYILPIPEFETVGGETYSLWDMIKELLRYPFGGKKIKGRI